MEEVCCPRCKVLEEENLALRQELERLKEQVQQQQQAPPTAAVHDSLWPIRQQLSSSSSGEVVSSRPSSAAKLPVAEKPMVVPDELKTRERILQELVDSESHYVKDLALLHHLFRNQFCSALDVNPPMLTREQFERIFSNAETLLRFNSEFLAQLDARHNGPTWEPERSTVGDLFLQYGPMFRMYGLYCANLGAALVEVGSLRSSSPEFATTLRMIERIPDVRSLKLESFLSLPMQRVPRYVLLLETLWKNTPDGHPDKELLQQALGKTREMAEEINRYVETHERDVKMLDVGALLVGCPFDLIVPARKFVKEGSFKKITSKFVIEDLYLLFSDMLVYCSRRVNGQLQYKGHIMLATSWVRDLLDTANVQNMFQVVSPGKTYTFFFNSATHKAEWFQAINGCIERLVEKEPRLKEQRGPVRPRHPDSGFHKVLQSIFSYKQEDFETEEPADIDEFVLMADEKDDETTIKVSEMDEKPPKEEVQPTDQQFNEFVYWNAPASTTENP